MADVSEKQIYTDEISLQNLVKEQKLGIDTNRYFLCVIIIAKNEEKHIEECIKSCIKALESFDDYKIILVDSISGDRTIEIAKKYDISIYQLTNEKLLSASAGRYIGSIYSSSEYVFYIDGDMLLDENWFKVSLKFLEQNPDISAVGGFSPDFVNNKLINPLNKVFMDSTIPLMVSKDQIEYKYLNELNGGAALFRRDCLSIAGYHNPFLRSGEEAELSFRLLGKGFRLARIKVPMILHLGLAKYEGASLERVKYYEGIGQILREYMFKNNLLKDKRYFNYLYFLGFLSLNVLFVLCSILVNKIFALFFVVINLLLCMLMMYKHRKPYMALMSFIKYYLKGYYILVGLLKGIKNPEEYPKEVKVIKNNA